MYVKLTELLRSTGRSFNRVMQKNSNCVFRKSSNKRLFQIQEENTGRRLIRVGEGRLFNFPQILVRYDRFYVCISPWEVSLKERRDTTPLADLGMLQEVGWALAN